MKIGVVYPQTEFGSDPGAIREFAQSAEALGYTHILAYEHVLGAKPPRPGEWPGPYTYEHPFHEPFILFSFMAASTKRIGFITGILILPQRQTVLVAKQAAALDILSGGRLRLGVGLGWNAVEYEALGEDFHTRGRRIEEQVQLLRRLWTEPLVEFCGRWHQVSTAGLNPMPVQQPIPLWFGGYVPAALERIARLGDGWLPGHRTAEEARSSLALLDEALKRAGRKEARQNGTFGIEPRLPYGMGDPAEWLRTIAGWQGVGATHLSLNTLGCGFDTPAKHLKALERFSSAIELKYPE